MKIIHILPAFTKGGGERVVIDLANVQIANGHDVSVIAGLKVDPHLLQNRLSPKANVTFLSRQATSVKSIYASIPFWVWRNRTLLFAQDVLHCHLTFGSIFGAFALLARTVSRGRSPVIVETYHAVGMAIPKYRRWIDSMLLKKRDALALMAEDSYWNEFLARNPKLLFRIIENGVDTSSRSANDPKAARQALGIPVGCGLVVGTVSQLRADREPWSFIPVFKQIADAIGPDVQFVIAGEGPERGRVETEIARYDMGGRVHLPGQVDSAADAALAMDLFLTLAVGSRVGIAALETAATGKPVIARQLDHQYLRQDHDFAWSDRDPVVLANEAIRILRSPVQLASLGTDQKMVVESQFSATAMANAYDSLYAAALSARSEAN
ncbi:MAG: glycosyltransferase [Casimicrobium sp.]